MGELKNKEVEYLQGKINEIAYSELRFKLMMGNERSVFGILSATNNLAPFSKLMQYKTIYDTLLDLDYKIKLSFEKAIEYSYSTNVQENFSIFKNGSMEETLAYYYIENALFRTSSLWDMLGQLYRLYYQIEIGQEQVYYKRIFNPLSSYSIKFKEKANEINDYINQEDDTDTDGEWKGNHKFINDCRNKMTHRNSPNIAVISDYDVNFKHYPSLLLKRIVEDYNVVSKYIGNILDKIEEEVTKDSFG